MPGVSGLDLLRQLRVMEAGGGRRTPVLILSADVTPESIRACEQAGARAFLAKPVVVGAAARHAGGDRRERAASDAPLVGAAQRPAQRRRHASTAGAATNSARWAWATASSASSSPSACATPTAAMVELRQAGEQADWDACPRAGACAQGRGQQPGPDQAGRGQRRDHAAARTGSSHANGRPGSTAWASAWRRAGQRSTRASGSGPRAEKASAKRTAAERIRPAGFPLLRALVPLGFGYCLSGGRGLPDAPAFPQSVSRAACFGLRQLRSRHAAPARGRDAPSCAATCRPAAARYPPRLR